MNSLLFLILAGMSVLLALYTVLTSKIIPATLGLMAVLILSAFFYLILGAEFIAGIQILVYVGGIVILIIYLVMLTKSSELLEASTSRLHRLIGAVISLLFFCLGLSVTSKMDFPPFADSPQIPISKMGQLLVSSEPGGYLMPFEVVSVLLLTCVIGAIVIARKKER